MFVHLIRIMKMKCVVAVMSSYDCSACVKTQCGIPTTLAYVVSMEQHIMAVFVNRCGSGLPSLIFGHPCLLFNNSGLGKVIVGYPNEEDVNCGSIYHFKNLVQLQINS